MSGHKPFRVSQGALPYARVLGLSWLILGGIIVGSVGTCIDVRESALVLFVIPSSLGIAIGLVTLLYRRGTTVDVERGTVKQWWGLGFGWIWRTTPLSEFVAVEYGEFRYSGKNYRSNPAWAVWLVGPRKRIRVNDALGSAEERMTAFAELLAADLGLVSHPAGHPPPAVRDSGRSSASPALRSPSSADPAGDGQRVSPEPRSPSETEALGSSPLRTPTFDGVWGGGALTLTAYKPQLEAILPRLSLGLFVAFAAFLVLGVAGFRSVGGWGMAATGAALLLTAVPRARRRSERGSYSRVARELRIETAGETAGYRQAPQSSRQLSADGEAFDVGVVADVQLRPLATTRGDPTGWWGVYLLLTDRVIRVEESRDEATMTALAHTLRRALGLPVQPPPVQPLPAHRERRFNEIAFLALVGLGLPLLLGLLYAMLSVTYRLTTGSPEHMPTPTTRFTVVALVFAFVVLISGPAGGVVGRRPMRRWVGAHFGRGRGASNGAVVAEHTSSM